jgi:hypothetical protein
MKFDALKITHMPIETIQKQINRRPQMSSDFIRGEDQADMKTGRVPHDTRKRWKEPIPPFHEQFKLHHEAGELTESSPESVKDHDNG